MAAQAAAFEEQFVQNLTAGAISYTSIEAALASLLQDLYANAGQAIGSLSLGAGLALLPVVQSPLISGILAIGAVAVIVAYVLSLYVVAAAAQFLQTGQILTLSAFLMQLGMGLFPMGLELF